MISVVDITTGVKPVAEKIPNQFMLEQNYPNPFNPTTKIDYQLPAVNHVNLTVFDVLGREIAVLVNETQQAGKHEIEWNAADYPSGVYFYKLTSGSYSKTKKMMLVK